MDKYNISQEWKNIIMGYIQSLKEENQFKEDRISDLLVERDKGVWKVQTKFNVYKEVYNALIDSGEDVGFIIFELEKKLDMYRNIGLKGGKFITNKVTKPEVTKSHNNQQDKPSEVKGNSSQS